MDDDTLLGLFKTMLLIRRFEERLQAMSQTPQAPPGMVILCNGQEAVAAGACAALLPDDVIVSNHRSHGHLLARGASPNLLMAEIFGRATGYNRGKSGTLHIAVPEVNALCTTTVVGGGIPIAAGIAFAMQYEQSGRACVCFFGEGASNEGSFHEAANLSAVWDLPIVFVCETNQYAGAQRFEERFKIKNVADRAAAYGMPGVIVDGNDVTAVFEATRQALERARAGSGPTLIECKTYRLLGHGTHDHQLYVPTDELDYWRAREPITRLLTTLESRGVLRETALSRMDAEIGSTVDEAVRFAQDSPWPAPHEALEDVCE
jgi:acetoin:2,6-dichlorophenolindophenol oxidoreductase subunit alpha